MASKKSATDLQSRAWCFVLYPDSTNYDYPLIVDTIKSFCDTQYAMILHDKDVYGEDDTDMGEESGDSNHTVGAPKKAHLHVVLKFASPKKIHQVRNLCKLPSNFYLEPVHKYKDALNYLIHNTDDSRHKYQYRVEDVDTNIPDYAVEVGAKTEVPCLRDILDIRENLLEESSVVHIGRLALAVLQNADPQMWAALRRNYSILRDINEYLNGAYRQTMEDIIDDYAREAQKRASAAEKLAEDTLALASSISQLYNN